MDLAALACLVRRQANLGVRPSDSSVPRCSSTFSTLLLSSCSPLTPRGLAWASAPSLETLTAVGPLTCPLTPRDVKTLRRRCDFVAACLTPPQAGSRLPISDPLVGGPTPAHLLAARGRGRPMLDASPLLREDVFECLFWFWFGTAADNLAA